MKGKNKILVTYGSWCGSTTEVAEEIGKTLRENGAEVEVRPVGEVRGFGDFRAAIIGTAIRAGRCRKDVKGFVQRNRQALSQIPVAYFSVGMQMNEDTPENREKAMSFLRPLREQVEPVDVAVFGGKFDLSKVGFPWNLFMKSVPEEDHRDWEAIRAWARELKDKLAAK